MPAKTVDAPTTSNQEEEQTALAMVLARLDVFEQRLVRLEGMAHSGHALTLPPEAIAHIAGVAVEQVKTEVLQPLGISGFPAKG